MESTDRTAVADMIAPWRPSEIYRLRTHAARSTRDAVAERGGRVVGWISYKIKACNPEVLAEYEDRAEGWLYVVEVYTAPTERRRGTGRALMRYVEAEGRSSGVRHSVLMPAADDSTPSGIDQDLLDFYGDLGYQLMKPSPKYHGEADPWLMGLEL